jgi:DNA-binding XRE family transcriptional regulator
LKSIEVYAMSLEEYRIQCGWSRSEMARQAGVDAATVGKAIKGIAVSIATADKLATAISKKLGRPIHFRDIEGLNVNL